MTTAENVQKLSEQFPVGTVVELTRSEFAGRRGTVTNVRAKGWGAFIDVDVTRFKGGKEMPVTKSVSVQENSVRILSDINEGLEPASTNGAEQEAAPVAEETAEQTPAE